MDKREEEEKKESEIAKLLEDLYQVDVKYSDGVVHHIFMRTIPQFVS